MDHAALRLLGAIVHGRSVAAIATLHDGLPFASMIPFAVWLEPIVFELTASKQTGERLRFITHVSRLSAHTRDMLESPQVCLLITAEEYSPGANGESTAILSQALPRVSIPTVAEFIDREHPDHAAFSQAYLEKFPHAADWFQLGDFSIVAFEPAASRFIAGFARAMTVSPAQLLAAVRLPRQ
ncbi:MAG: pyridoxamine 5'-phosphate oxidase family protein [Planctomycetota bacterium]